MLEYQPVTVNGKFLNDREIHVVYALTSPKGKLGGFGFMVMTPFVADAGWVVYVNRGFVPAAAVDPATRAASQIEGETSVVGVLRGPADRAWFMGGDEAAKNQWISRDPKLYAAAQTLPSADVAPYLIDAKFERLASRRHPAGRRNRHRVPQQPTSATRSPGSAWALCCAGVYIAFAMGKLRKPRQ